MAKLTEQNKTLLRYFLLDGMNQGDAARKAGYADSSADSVASRVLKMDEAKEYLEELREQVCRASSVTIEAQIDKLDILYEKAMKSGQMSAAVGALKEINTMKGFHAPKKGQLDLNTNPVTLEDKEAFAATVFDHITGRQDGI